MKESKESQAEETDLMEASKACQQAITVLSAHHPEFTQLNAAALTLKAARVTHLLAHSTKVSAEDLEAFRSFLRHATDDASPQSSFLAIPGFRSYAPQSGQIFGILKQMKADFDEELSEATAAEKKAQEDYAALKAAKEEEIAAGRKAIVQLDADIADFSDKHAAAAQELADTAAQLELDKTFLETLKEKCSESAEEFDKRVKSRLEEITAVDDTIAILNTDEAFDVFDKSVNPSFLQTSSALSSHEQRKKRAIVELQRADQFAAQLQGASSASKALVMASMSMDAFDKVIEEVDKLVAELGKQQKDEVAQRDWCIDELAKNDRSTNAADDKKVSLETKISDLEKSIETMTADIESAKASVAETEKQMKYASEDREAESAENLQTIADQRLTQMILDKAIARMKEVYAFLQQQPGAAHIATSGTHTDPGNGPARFTKYEQNAKGSKVLTMLETVRSDSQKVEDDTMTSEDDSQTAYENMMKDSNKAITRETETIANLSENRAKAKEALTMAKTDLSNTVEELGDLSDMKSDIHKSCDFVMDNFDARQSARAAEMDALKEAKAILKGMK
jgi:DNA repair exonuclease SbcCD ATPase subunit